MTPQSPSLPRLDHRQALQTLLALARELSVADVVAVRWHGQGVAPLLPDLVLPVVDLAWLSTLAAPSPPQRQVHQQLPAAVPPGTPWRYLATVPVLDADQVRGDLWLLVREPLALSAAVSAQLLALADLLAQQWRQHQALEQLSAEAARLQDLVRASGDWSWELDAQLRHVWLGGNYQAMTGEDPAQLLGQTGGAERVVDAEGQPWPDSVQVQEVLARQQPVSRLLSLRNTPLGERFLSRSAVPLADAQGRFCGFRGTTRDLTRQMHSEREARAQRQVLAGLQRDKDLADLANRAKNSLLSRVSHELRTPLNAVMGFSQLMSADEAHALPSTQAARLSGIVSAGQRLLVVVDDLLELVSVERQAQDSAPDAIDLRQVAERAVQAWQVRAAQVGRAVLWRDHGPVPAQAPPQVVDQILNRLLTDALACGGANEPVCVAARLDGAQALLDVSHAVVPGAALDLVQLFEPFDFTGLEERSPHASGLDLVIARDLARACGGDAAAHLGNAGALHVLVSLPTGAGLALAPEPAPPVAAAHCQVLYVEDEPLNVVLMQEIFRGRPEWVLHVARDGSEGVALAQQLQPDLMLVDMNLPDFGGLEVLRRLRADPSTQAIPAIALSADAMTEQVAAARAAGFQDYWTKPIDLNALLKDVAAALAKST
jgi:CheY-like chemotaxis protein/PAS domain-containing protein